MSRKRTNLLIATLAVVAWGAAGCQGGSGDEAGESPPPSNAPVALPSGVAGATAVPTAVQNKTESRKNVKVSDCKATPDGWQASGTANNPGKAKTKYTITVFFTTKGGTVIGTGQTKVDVKPRADSEWSIASKFKPAPDTQCVLRGVS